MPRLWFFSCVSFFIDHWLNRVFIFSRSSLGTLVLIYLTLRVRQSGDGYYVHVWWSLPSLPFHFICFYVFLWSSLENYCWSSLHNVDTNMLPRDLYISSAIHISTRFSVISNYHKLFSIFIFRTDYCEKSNAIEIWCKILWEE